MLDFLLEKLQDNIQTRPMTNEYYNLLPQDKVYAYYEPSHKNTKYWEVILYNNRVGYVGYVYEERKYWGIVYIEKKYRGTELLKIMYNVLLDKLNNKKLYAKVEKDNIQAIKAHKKLFKLMGKYDEDHLMFRIAWIFKPNLSKNRELKSVNY